MGFTSKTNMLYLSLINDGVNQSIGQRLLRRHIVVPLRVSLGLFFVALNYICLSFMQIHAHFYINYIIYYGLLIFCCQNVATHLL